MDTQSHAFMVTRAAQSELAAEEWAALVRVEKQRILRRRSRWQTFKAWLTGRVTVTVTWRNQ